MKTEKVEKLSPAALQKLAELYDGYEKAIKAAQKKQNEIWDDLVTQVRKFGSAAPKSDKTFRVESAGYFIDASFGQSVEINDAAVLQLKERCKPGAETKLFGGLFEEKSYFVKKAGAEELIAEQRVSLRNLFDRCFDIKAKAPALKVKAKKPGKKKGAVVK